MSSSTESSSSSNSSRSSLSSSRDSSAPVIDVKLNGGGGVRDRIGRLYCMELYVSIREETLPEGQGMRKLILDKFLDLDLDGYLCSMEQVVDGGDGGHLSTMAAADAAVPSIKISLFMELKVPVNMSTLRREVASRVSGICEHFDADEGTNEGRGDLNAARASREFNCLKVELSRIKSKKTLLKKISSRGEHLLTNIPRDQLSFSYKVARFAEENKDGQFDPLHPLVRQNWSSYRCLESAVTSRKLNDSRRASSQVRLRLVDIDSCTVKWTREAASLWNERVGSESSKPREIPQLYLWGPTRMGKSTFVLEKLIGGDCAQSFVYYPDKGKYFMETFDPEIHKVILFEEFDVNDFPVNSLKRLAGAEMYKYSVKGKRGRDLQFFGPIIFVSNYLNITDKALLDRLRIFHSIETSYAVKSVDEATKTASLTLSLSRSLFLSEGSREQETRGRSTAQEALSGEQLHKYFVFSINTFVSRKLYFAT